MKKAIWGAGIALGLSIALSAQTSPNAMHFKVAASSSSGTYADMISEIKETCEANGDYVIDASVVKGQGAPDNLDAVVNNQAQAAAAHADVLYAKAQFDPNYKSLKTLVALYPEEIHIVALRDSKAYIGRVFKTQVPFNSLVDLKGWPVGAAGGGFYTATIMASQAGGGYTPVMYPSGDEAKAALLNGSVHAIVVVGGAPLKFIQSLDANTFKLIPIGDAITSRMPGVYKPAVVNYGTLGTGIKTMAPQALIVTKRYTIAKFVAPQARFRDCFYSNLSEMKETPGKHPKWQYVNADDHGVWDWYEFPAGATIPVPAIRRIK